MLDVGALVALPAAGATSSPVVFAHRQGCRFVRPRRQPVSRTA